MEPQREETVASASGNQQVGTGFGKFMVKLAGLLTVQIVLGLATYFEFSKVQRETLQAAEYPGQLMVDCLNERGVITQTDISPLINALEFLKLEGVKQEVISSFQSYLPTSNPPSGKLNQLQRFLKAAYELLYKGIQPIPYIRDKLFCVNDVFVEGGIELTNGKDKEESAAASSLSQPRTQNKPLESYRDIFNDNIIPSKRVIVEGEPGYGKSTLTLQAAYDWCQGRSPSSSLQGVELFILLRLRLLKGITSIYKAIRLFILPRDCNLSESEIKDIINSCSSVVIVLDGYDEYPDINSDLNSDFMEIIKGKMFTNFKLILCTRSGCLPSNRDPRTVSVRLTGFDADSRDRYIRKAVIGDSTERRNDIRTNLEKNPIMCDLCRVPLFFVMFAHMTYESKDIYKCNSVTSFFKYMIQCLYSHMLKKREETGAMSRSDSANKGGLYKLAFQGLAGEEQNIVWEKREFCHKVGTDCFEELIRIGILIEEKTLEMNMTSELSVSGYIQEKTIVRFYHKLFAEWYAAHYVAERASSKFIAFSLDRTLRKVNPIDLQFVFRFACGLKPFCTKRIVNYLRKIDGGGSFATLCILEQAGGTDDILDTVREMCSREVKFSNQDSQLLHWSRMQLCDIAAKNQIPVSSVSLFDCFQFVDLKEECLYLSSGSQLPRLDTLKELGIYAILDLRDKAKDILDYSARCVALKTLKFGSFHHVLLPQSFDDIDVLARLQRKNCKVLWGYYLFAGYYHWKLNLQSGKWEGNGEEMTDGSYRRIVSKLQKRTKLEACLIDDWVVVSNPRLTHTFSEEQNDQGEARLCGVNI